MSRETVIFMVLIICAAQWHEVENKSFFGIGMRIIGDQLLLKDLVLAPMPPFDEPARIRFNYAIMEQITYIEIIAEQNVYAEVNFSYEDDLVKGTAVKINDSTGRIVDEPFEVLIRIYGFNDTMLNINPAYVLNKDQHFKGLLEPMELGDDDEDNEDNEEYLNVSSDDLEPVDGTLLPDDQDDIYEDNELDGLHENDDDNEFGSESEPLNKIIDLGTRQNGDYLIYEHFLFSDPTDGPENHSVVFYYIDSNPITYIQFVVYDHYLEKSVTNKNYMAPIVEYSHFSPKQLKAIVTDQRVKSLFVKMFLYGYKSTEVLPVDYEPYMMKLLPNRDRSEGEGDGDDDDDDDSDDAAGSRVLLTTESPIRQVMRMRLANQQRQLDIAAGASTDVNQVGVQCRKQGSTSGAASMSASLLIASLGGSGSASAISWTAMWLAVICARLLLPWRSLSLFAF